jgi:hypothetical protein
VLKDAGIPSLIQRAAGFDAPDFLSAGPRDVLDVCCQVLMPITP